ncbi:hypothetical protein CKK33_09475 [Mucilaginibacter sp. MD40]|uniref:M56 family metallopeptidase n=1 Tax=Mucilaginibacter sp. MD40 TaxID=2029590 RepID=UPI000BAC7432|nr:M56 family metallopeptidase [Mucilaginibacter sp. MD40]PAW93710.1 hypothetical protein CKK33_09475 [Mucilaginibacter sp. MD40]
MSWLHYLTEANIYLLVFYLCYRLLLAGNTHYTLSRVYLILSCIISFIIPLMQVSVLRPNIQEVQTFTKVSYVLPAANLNIPVQNQGFEFSVKNILPYIYITGTLIAAIVFAVRLWCLLKITKAGKACKYGNYQRIDLPDQKTAFSFFNYLYIGTGLKQPDTIIAHELVHIRQKHTLDVLFLEILKIVNWFSPVVYLVQQSLKTLHEYIADEQTAALERDALSYSSFLLNNAYGLAGAPVTHSFFNNNLLKRRIIMLNQKRSGKLARLKYLAAVPLSAGMLCTSTLLFSKNYGVIELGPIKQKKMAVQQIDSGKYALKLTELKSGLTVISDDIELKDSAANKSKLYSVKTFSGEPQEVNLKGNWYRIEKVLRDSTKVLSEQKQHPLPPPPPPIFPVKTPFTAFTQYIINKVKYPAEAVKNNQNANVLLSFDVNSAGRVSNARVAGKPGSAFNDVLANTVNQFNGKINTHAGTYKMNVHYFILGHEGVSFPPPFVTKSTNYIGEIQIVGMTKAQDSMMNMPPPPPPPIEPRKKVKGIPPPPPIEKLSDVNNADQDKSLKALYTHLGRTVRYPAIAFESDKQGRVILTFNVEDKKISNIRIIRGLMPIMDGEVVRAMNDFDKPLNLKNGKYSMPVLFAITNDSKEPDVKKEYPATGYTLTKGETTTILSEVVIMGYKSKS